MKSERSVSGGVKGFSGGVGGEFWLVVELMEGLDDGGR